MVAGIWNTLFSHSIYTVDQVNETLDEFSPLTIVAATVVGMSALSRLAQNYREGTFKPLIARALLNIPALREQYKEKIRREYAQMRAGVLKAWEPFGKPFLEIPEKGMQALPLIELIQKYCEVTVNPLREQNISGTIYQRNLTALPPLLNPEEFDLENPDQMKQLEELFTYAFKRSYLFNSLHTKEFTIGSFLKYQIIQMLSELHGGNPNEVMGLVTTGGSESLLAAVRSYRDYCREHKGHKAGETVLIAPDTIHAGVLKAETMYGVKIVLVPTDKSGAVDEKEVYKAVKQYGKRVGAIFCSAPCYKTGKMDPVEKLAAFAHRNQIGLHVDHCLGAFFDDKKYLAIQGVTSLSVDTHKGGLAPKGSSVLLLNEMPNQENLYYYAIFSLPNWSGGIYGTPNTAGSEPCTHLFHAFLAMLFIGKEGYREKAKKIRESALAFAGAIRETEGLKLLGSPDLHVVTFEMDPKVKWRKGAIYQFAKEMDQRGFTFNAMLDESLHFCVTDRFNPGSIKALKKAAQESLEEIERLNKGDKPFPQAKMYCSMSEALSPNLKTQSWGGYLGNWLFGAQAAHELVKRHYCTTSNPNALWKRVASRT